MAEMTARVTFVDGMRFVGVGGDSGASVLMDASPEHGGSEGGLRPTELVLIGLGGCTAMDAISILKKKRQEVTAFEILVKGQRAEDHPKRFTDIEIEFVVTGKGVSPEAVERAVNLSMEKYCSVKATLEQETKVKFSWRVEAA